jgi:hypothetical protein
MDGGVVFKDIVWRSWVIRTDRKEAIYDARSAKPSVVGTFTTMRIPVLAMHQMVGYPLLVGLV